MAIDELISDPRELREFLREHGERLEETPPLDVRVDKLGELVVPRDTPVSQLPGDLGYCAPCEEGGRVRFATVEGFHPGRHYCHPCAHDLAVRGLGQAKRERKRAEKKAAVKRTKKRKRRGARRS